MDFEVGNLFSYALELALFNGNISQDGYNLSLSAVTPDFNCMNYLLTQCVFLSLTVLINVLVKNPRLLSQKKLVFIAAFPPPQKTLRKWQEHLKKLHYCCLWQFNKIFVILATI